MRDGLRRGWNELRRTALHVRNESYRTLCLGSVSASIPLCNPVRAPFVGLSFRL